ncbi:lysozyme inhibitor LprI family protein [Jannaschia pohangensis]|uniref:Lysozyme inhibitor LprI N-terminal domain-containing protein n=1 Tax=Jannaschia pohangensis TaxID=390807 RepID=A0A1I3HJZ2_9RHOB|nr:hypothetical protein [Jannaschia pohangensis]SFI35897.1 hypothetical protein SAMN04488095_0624 [Jannaschia pohangensis]
MLRALIFWAMTLGLPQAAFAQSPSFDCRAAGTPTEFAICRDGRLAQLDVAMVDAYKAAQTDAATVERLARDQSIWRRWRDTCLDDRACLTRRYTARIADLQPFLILPEGFEFTVLDAPTADPPTGDIVTRLNGDRYERVYPDGTIRWAVVGGIDSGVIFPDGSQSLFSPIQVGGTDLPTLPGTATPWVTEMETRLLSIVDTHLPPEDHAPYRALQAGFPLDERVMRHIEAIRFLSFR